MANTVKTTKRTIEVSAIDADYMMSDGEIIWSVFFVPGAKGDEAFISEDSVETVDPVKCHLRLGLDTEAYQPLEHYFHGQKMRLGFDFSDGTFSGGSKVIFNIGDRGGR